MRGAGGDQTLDAIQANRFVISVISTMQTAEEMYYQHEDGMISESRWSTQVRRMKFQARDRGFRAAWQVTRNVFEADFALFVDSLVNISDGGDRSGELFAPAWKQALASM